MMLAGGYRLLKGHMTDFTKCVLHIRLGTFVCSAYGTTILYVVTIRFSEPSQLPF